MQDDRLKERKHLHSNDILMDQIFSMKSSGSQHYPLVVLINVKNGKTGDEPE